MCLLARYKAKKAEKDIICYKAYLSTIHGIVSPIQGVPIDPEPRADNFNPTYDAGHHVSYGIHSIKNSEDVKLVFKDEAYIIFKCIIPKGVMYYEGMDSFDSYGYCSERIEFKGVIQGEGLLRKCLTKYPFLSCVCTT